MSAVICTVLCPSQRLTCRRLAPISRDGPRWALLIPDARAAALFRATPRRNTDGPHLVSKARPEVGRQFASEDRRRTTDATNHLAATPATQSGRSVLPPSRWLASIPNLPPMALTDHAAI